MNKRGKLLAHTYISIHFVSKKLSIMEKFIVRTTNTGAIEAAHGKEAVGQLENHWITRQLKREDNTFIWKTGCETHMMGGLTKLIRRKFYPDSISFKKSKRKSGGIGGNGKSNGTRVHRQIYHMVVCLGKRNCDCEIKTNPKRLNILTTQAFSVFKNLEFTPLNAEIIILSKIGKFCTQLDVIGNRFHGTPKQRSTIISIKTGYSTEYDKCKGNSRMNAPLDFLLSTARNHNQLQGMLERYILRHEYGITFDDYFIVYLGHSQTGEPHVEELDKWCLSDDICKQVYDAIQVSVGSKVCSSPTHISVSEGTTQIASSSLFSSSTERISSARVEVVDLTSMEE